jgi:hypothetical protein
MQVDEALQKSQQLKASRSRSKFLSNEGGTVPRTVPRTGSVPATDDNTEQPNRVGAFFK